MIVSNDRKPAVFKITTFGLGWRPAQVNHESLESYDFRLPGVTGSCVGESSRSENYKLGREEKEHNRRK